jgi:predicted MFS family arabinose efflux permease
VRAPNRWPRSTAASGRLAAPLIYVLLFLQALVFSAFFPLAPSFEDTLGLSTLEIGAVYASFGITMLLFGIPIGLLIDRFGAQRLTIGAAGALTAAAVGHAAAVDFSSLFLARMVLGVAAAAALAGGIVWLTRLIRPERRAVALSATMPIIGAGAIVGPLLGGLLGQATDRRAPFIVGALAALAVTVGLACCRAVARSQRGDRAPRVHEIVALRSEPLVVAGVVAVMLAALCESTVNLLAPLQLDAEGLSAAAIGLVLSVAAGIFLAASAVAARFASYSVSVVSAGVGALVLAAFLMPLVLGESSAAISTGVVLRMAALGLLWTIAFPLAALGSETSPVGHGAINGLLLLTLGAGNTLGPLAGGALATLAGDRAVYLLLAALAVATGTLLLVAVHRQRRRGPQQARLSAKPPLG